MVPPVTSKNSGPWRFQLCSMAGRLVISSWAGHHLIYVCIYNTLSMLGSNQASLILGHQCFSTELPSQPIHGLLNSKNLQFYHTTFPMESQFNPLAVHFVYIKVNVNA